MAGLSTLCLISALAVASSVAVTQSALRHDKHHRRHGGSGKTDTFVAGLQFQHRLRVCNAYPYSAAMDVYQAREKVTGDGPMEYKTCRDFLAPLKSGDKLEFKVGDASAGVFSVSDLPNNDAILLLIIQRHDTLSTSVSFESHVFANLLNAQLAVIDTYKGKAVSKLQIMDAALPGTDTRKEELKYNSVVAVNPGLYHVALTSAEKAEEAEEAEEPVATHGHAAFLESGERDASHPAPATAAKAIAKHDLVALNRESYVVIRTGVEAEQGPSYPQELVVYPQSDPAALHGKGSATYLTIWTLFSVVVVTLNLQ